MREQSGYSPQEQELAAQKKTTTETAPDEEFDATFAESTGDGDVLAAEQEVDEDIPEALSREEYVADEVAAAEAELEGAEEVPELVVDIEKMKGGIQDFSEQISSESGAEAGNEELKNKMGKILEILQPMYEEATGKINDLIENGRATEAELNKIALDTVNNARNKISGIIEQKIDKWFANHDDIRTDAEMEPDAEKKDKMMKLALEAVDFVPFVGSVKMISEGVAGRTLQGRKLTGAKRIFHTAEGSVFLLLDTVSFGGGSVVKGGIKSSKLLTRSAAIARKLGMSRKFYKPLYKMGRLVAKYPMAAKALDKGVHYIQARRQKRHIRVAEEAQDVILGNDVKRTKRPAQAA